MEVIIQTIGLAVASVLGLATILIIARSQWNIFHREQRQLQQHK